MSGACKQVILPVAVLAIVEALALEEHRTLSAMIRVLVAEALANRGK